MPAKDPVSGIQHQHIQPQRTRYQKPTFVNCAITDLMFFCYLSKKEMIDGETSDSRPGERQDFMQPITNPLDRPNKESN